MTAAMDRRVARLEQAASDGQRPALVIVHGAGFDPESITSVDGIDIHREEGESACAYLERLSVHLRATRGRALPFLGLACYGPDDAPDGPPVQNAASAMLISTVPSCRETGEMKATP